MLLFCKPKCWFSCVGGEGSHLFRLAVEWMKLGSWPNLFAGARLGFTLNDRLEMKCDGSLIKNFSSKQLITNMNYVVWTQYPNMWHHMHPHTHTLTLYIYIHIIYRYFFWDCILFISQMDMHILYMEHLVYYEATGEIWRESVWHDETKVADEKKVNKSTERGTMSHPTLPQILPKCAGPRL